MKLREALSKTVAENVTVKMFQVIKEVGQDKANELASAKMGKTEKERVGRRSVRKNNLTGDVMMTVNRQQLLNALEKGAVNEKQGGAGQGTAKDKK